MMMESIISLGFIVVALIAGAFGIGHARVTNTAESRAKQQRTEESAAANVEVAERKAQATKEASDVQQTVSHMPDDDVDRELRENFTRKT